MQFAHTKVLFYVLSLSLFFAKRTTATQTSKKHPLSELYSNALRDDFNDCMNKIEMDNMRYHSCQGFSSVEDCRCSFLKDVNHQCKSLGAKSSNYWYFEHQMQSNCKKIPKVGYSLEILSRYIGNNDFSYDHKLGINASVYGAGTFKTDTPTQYNSLEEYEPHELDTYDLSHELHKRSNAAIDTLDFKEYYEKKKPNAMTINCKLMRSLKITASPTNHQMTQFSTTILVQNPTGTHTTSIEAIMVLPKNKEQSQDSRNDKRSNIVRVNATTNFKEASVVYMSDASFFSQQISLILLTASVLLSLIFVPCYIL
ncbi:uncharacterized protein AC631_02978 [Debaryomyces fabryi]|uniref:Uncharacterized protein n=1 Tax=Debaryomyces fabryi TaxID=58627 RepID=A0A0V1PYQ4_9ASCO|nr:uncharacterized protein AC631_02978 [Debaryomyces fabryi]KSA01282.1 hypothetical protein AC631_02978 [Debaryomyces fabryi]